MMGMLVNKISNIDAIADKISKLERRKN